MSQGDPSTGFHLGGFLLGLFLPLVGVLISFLIGGDADIRHNRTKWAWYGTSITLGIIAILLKSYTN